MNEKSNCPINDLNSGNSIRDITTNKYDDTRYDLDCNIGYGHEVDYEGGPSDADADG